ncbi:MAG: 3-deoxy-7-phosphoheptulonate synthase [Desulfosalsimonas sp.]|uniref:3-deoxy-7-phosphoheptulonate synthase n=1 Tax=Desulfosalsimonas sp. TaxID=3073848 RepID=UPI0039706EBB
MLIVLEPDITQKQKNQIYRILREGGCISREITEAGRHIIGSTGDAGRPPDFFESLEGVARVVPVNTAFKLVSRQMHPEDTRVQVGDVSVGGERIVVIAGPCAVENRERTLSIAGQVRKYGAVLFRGGAFKPRTSPYAFQGLGEEGLKILAEVRQTFGMPVVTEITTPAQADLVMKYVDVIQIGARNMQNFELLKCVGRLGKPVLLKRGLAATIEEWLMSAEYIVSEGNDNVILCERGIRTFEPYTRNTLDLSAIPVIKNLTHLPVIIDPSHATGIREKVSPMARAAIAAGADGLMIEVHDDPDHALSDGAQSLYPEQFSRLMRDLYVISPVVDKQLDFGYLDKARAVDRMQKAGNGQGRRAAFLGEPGTYSHKACMQYFGGQVQPVPMDSFKEIYETVREGAADFGVIPLENSLAGSVHENYDLLLEYDLRIVGEILLRIEHHLIGHPEARVEDIRRVYSHPQVFQQCRSYIDRHQWEWIPVSDTARAVRLVKEQNNPAEGALAGRDAARIHEMQILEQGIEANARNYTRFVVIAREPISGGQKNKSSLIFSTGNQPGALFEALKVFADKGINLVKLESRPIHGKPWEYMFYVDLEADVDSDELAPVIRQLEQKIDYLKILGSY